MSDFVRRIVSGNKKRYQDEDFELDLVYITRQIIVMGYPASGVEGLYRNKREDIVKFLRKKHGQEYWVFNFCPVNENSYPSTVFQDRISRYPFPDHHVPPLAVLPLVAREIHTWLEGSSERVAILHCKAGKGRSGTMACSYLLALTRPDLLQIIEPERRLRKEIPQLGNGLSNGSLIGNGDANITRKNSYQGREIDEAHDKAKDKLDLVLAFHTSQRMKAPSSSSKSENAKQGVSIPSQRRWLKYWYRLLENQGPPGFWSAKTEHRNRRAPKVRLTQIRVRMYPLSGLKTGLVKTANAVMNHASFGAATRAATAAQTEGKVWASLARYDDKLVNLLEKWEFYTRDEKTIGRSRKGSEQTGEEALKDVFKEETWDNKKMVRSFARFGALEKDTNQKEDAQDGKTIKTQLLRPLTADKEGVSVEDAKRRGLKRSGVAIDNDVRSSEPSLNGRTSIDDGGVILNANREVRVKLHMGRVFMGWLWFIPTFHMPHPRSSTTEIVTLTLTKKELDFPIGVGSNVVDVTVWMKWCDESEDTLDPPARTGSMESARGEGEPAGAMATLQAAAAGDVGRMMEAKQAAED